MTVPPEISIAGRAIGPDQPPYVIAEMSNNHLQDLDRAVALLEAAHRAGVDAVKIQTYSADSITIDCDAPDFQIHHELWKGQTLHQLYRRISMPKEQQVTLFEAARHMGLVLFSSPFDDDAVDFLESMDCPAYKVASFEAVDHELIARVARTGKPTIISTGIANVEEIAEAVAAFRQAGGCDLILLHCVSAYPAPVAETNLLTIPDLGSRFGVLAGLSDHSLSPAVPVAAVAVGAVVLEKHFTLRREDGGPDAEFSLEPEELAALVRDTRTAWAALGQADYSRKPSETGTAVFRRSLYVVEDIPAGGILTRANIRSIRPGHGLAPKHLTEILGRPATRALARGTALRWNDVQR